MYLTKESKESKSILKYYEINITDIHTYIYIYIYIYIYTIYTIYNFTEIYFFSPKINKALIH